MLGASGAVHADIYKWVDANGVTNYTDNPDLAGGALKETDVLLIFANIVQITPEQEKGLLDFVNNGGGFVPVHSASFCFHNSPKYIELVGAQFKSHGGEVFTSTITDVP